jgi:hypothetical protein
MIPMNAQFGNAKKTNFIMYKYENMKTGSATRHDAKK